MTTTTAKRLPILSPPPPRPSKEVSLRDIFQGKLSSAEAVAEDEEEVRRNNNLLIIH